VTEAEGWYIDPFGRHELRWFSDGRPTALVRDGQTDGHDQPPAQTWDGPVQEPAEAPVMNEALRADAEPEQPTDGVGHYG